MVDEYFAKGKRGNVFLREENGRLVLVKVKRPESAVDTIANEARFTERLNAHGVGPRFISYKDGELVREYVEGEEFRKWLPSAGKEELRNVLFAVMKQCKVMDDLGINKLEMTRPWKHIIVRADGSSFLIDFERCKETRLPKNVTQFCQFLCGTRLTIALREKGLTFDTKRLQELAKVYKQNIKENKRKDNNMVFDNIIKVVKNG